MRNLWCFLGAVLSFGVAMVPGAASGQTISLVQQAEIAPGGSWSFGNSVALSAAGDTALVSPDFPSPECGQNGLCPITNVFAYRSGQWLREAALILPYPEGNDGYGPVVALSGDGNTALVGLRNKDCDTGFDCGIAYVFLRSGETWSLQATLRPSDEKPEKFFGFSVALSRDGSTALVGAAWEDCGETGELCGSAYVFTRSSSAWSQQAKLTSSARAHREFFGQGLALSSDGNTALIGAYGDRRAAPECDPYFCGAAYVFVRNGSAWSEERKLTAPSPRPNSGFGYSVALSGDGGTVAVGSLIAKIHIFTRGGGSWAVDQVLEHTSSSYFGFSMDLSENGDSLLAGDIGASCRTYPMGFDCGAAYLFLKRRGTPWRQVQEIAGSTPAGSDGHFGRSVALSGDGRIALVGAPEEGCAYPATECGSAYIFGAPPRSW